MTGEGRSMVVGFSTYPIGSTHFSGELGKVAKVLEGSGLEYKVGPTSTALRGNWDEIMKVIRTCHDVMAEGSERVITTITIDDRHQAQHGLKERVDRMEQQSAS